MTSLQRDESRSPTVEVSEPMAREIRWVARVRGQSEEQLLAEVWQEFTKPLRLEAENP